MSAGVALSPYAHDERYSRTEPRARALWLEFDRPPDDPGDSYFARVLRRVSDPLLSADSDQVPNAPEPALAIDPEPVRQVVPGQDDDEAGLGAMQPLVPSTNPLHWLLPLPPGMTDESAELLDMFTYELRVGHARRWSTAQGRYGAPLRVTGVQHPPPRLVCVVGRTSEALSCSAPFALPAEGRGERERIPRTQLWMFVYVQMRRADADGFVNVLLSHRRADPDEQAPRGPLPHGTAAWTQSELNYALAALAMPADAPLSCLAAETLPGVEPKEDPLGRELGRERLLRVSELTAAPQVCC